MRHGKKFKHLNRKSAHRKATLASMASSLIKHKRITTTVAKAKALKKYIEPLITRAKPEYNSTIESSTHSRRLVFSYLQDKEAIKELFSDVAEKVAERPGGYTRIIKLGSRAGDNAEMCLIELVDYNETLLNDTDQSKKKRTRRKSKKTTTTSSSTKVEKEKAVEDIEVEEETSEEKTVEEDTSESSEESKTDEANEEKEDAASDSEEEQK